MTASILSPTFIKRCQNREEAARDELYEFCRVALYRYIAGRTSSRSDAQDIFSETMMHIVQGIDSFSLERAPQFRGRLYRIAYHQILDRSKKSVHFVSNEETDRSKKDGHDETITPSANTAIIREEVEKQLHTLDPIEQEILVLRIRNHLSFDEISEIVGKNSDACKQTLYRSVKTLSTRLGHLAPLFLSFFS